MKTERVEMTSYESLSMLAGRLDLNDDVTVPLEDNSNDRHTSRSEQRSRIQR